MNIAYNGVKWYNEAHDEILGINLRLEMKLYKVKGFYNIKKTYYIIIAI